MINAYPPLEKVFKIIFIGLEEKNRPDTLRREGTSGLTGLSFICNKEQSRSVEVRPMNIRQGPEGVYIHAGYKFIDQNCMLD